MSSILDALQWFQGYLDGDDPTLLEKRMTYYVKKRAEFNQDFYMKLIDDPELSEVIPAILDGLGIPENKRSRFIKEGKTVYAQLSVYDFLAELRELAKTDKDKLEHFIQAIDERDESIKKVLNIVRWTLILAASTLPAFFNLGGVTLVQSLLAVTLFVPVVGIVFTVGIAAYSFYQNSIDNTKSLYQRFHDNFFLLASTALNIAAYSVLITAATAMSPLAATLFVVAAGVDVIKEVSNLIKISVENKKLGPITDKDTLEQQQEKTRAANAQVKTRNAVVIELSSAALMVGIVAMWSFAPAGIAVSIAAVVAIGLVYLAKKLASSYNEKTMKTHLKDDFSTLENDYEKKNGLQLGNHLKAEASLDLDSGQKINAQLKDGLGREHEEDKKEHVQGQVETRNDAEHAIKAGDDLLADGRGADHPKTNIKDRLSQQKQEEDPLNVSSPAIHQK